MRLPRQPQIVVSHGGSGWLWTSFSSTDQADLVLEGSQTQWDKPPRARRRGDIADGAIVLALSSVGISQGKVSPG